MGMVPVAAGADWSLAPAATAAGAMAHVLARTRPASQGLVATSRLGCAGETKAAVAVAFLPPRPPQPQMRRYFSRNLSLLAMGSARAPAAMQGVSANPASAKAPAAGRSLIHGGCASTRWLRRPWGTRPPWTKEAPPQVCAAPGQPS